MSEKDYVRRNYRDTIFHELFSDRKNRCGSIKVP